MIQYQCEEYKDCLAECQTYYQEHHDEVYGVDGPTLDPNYDMYHTLANARLLKTITCRKDGVLIGYVQYVLGYSLHYKTVLTAYEDIYYLKRSERKGRVGLDMFKYAENYLKSIGVSEIKCGTNLNVDNTKLFTYLKYQPIEKVFSKLI